VRQRYHRDPNSPGTAPEGSPATQAIADLTGTEGLKARGGKRHRHGMYTYRAMPGDRMVSIEFRRGAARRPPIPVTTRSCRPVGEPGGLEKCRRVTVATALPLATRFTDKTAVKGGGHYSLGPGCLGSAGRRGALVHSPFGGQGG